MPLALSVTARRRLFASILLVVAAAGAVQLVLILWSEPADNLRGLMTLGAGFILFATLAAQLSYVIRVMRWHAIMRWSGHSLPPLANTLVYIAGFALTLTPGKSGELVRSAILLQFGVPVRTSFGAFVIDRFSDVLGVLLLLTGAALALSGRWYTLVGAVTLLVILLAGSLGAALWLRRVRVLHSAVPLGRWRRLQRNVVAVAHGWSELWTVRRAALCVLASAAAFAVHGLIFAAYVNQFWPQAGVAASLFGFCASLLIGAASLLPGGLGATEVSLVYFGQDLGLTPAQAVVVALALRFSTLWVGVLLGVVALTVLLHRALQPAKAGAADPI